jgi:CubicO group peptidase (beta-lactamase class C family)
MRDAMPMIAGNETSLEFSPADVTIANWRMRPYNTWAFSHVAEVVPSDRIAAIPATPADAVVNDPAFLSESVVLDKGRETVLSFLSRSQSDVLLVQRNGRTIAEWSARHAMPWRPHIVFSVTKSVTGLLCGIAQDMGILDTGRPVGDYLPETRVGAYGDCPVRHLLDMRVSLDLEEAYLDPTSDFARYRRAVLWNPPDPSQPTEGLADFLNGVKKRSVPHGGAFAYQSPNSDMLGLLLEHVTGDGYAALASRSLWQPMGALDDAFITVDRFGTARAAGGLSCRAHDLARIGALMLEPNDILSERWLAETWKGGDRNAWDMGDFRDFIPGGAYTNQWYLLPPPADALMAMGIHGQFLYIHRPTRTVIVKMGSQNLPQDDRLDHPNLSFLHQLAARIT